MITEKSLIEVYPNREWTCEDSRFTIHKIYGKYGFEFQGNRYEYVSGYDKLDEVIREMNRIVRS